MADIVKDYTKKCAPHIFGCPLYLHSTRKACFVRLRGVHMPPYVGMAPCLWMPPYASLYVWVPPVCFDTPICLDAPHVWMSPVHANTKKACFVTLGGVHMPQYIWMSPVHKQHKESILCQTKGVSICPYIWMPPYV